MERFPRLAGELVRLKLDLIVAAKYACGAGCTASHHHDRR